MTPKEIAKKIIPILRSYGAKKASVFGSVSRGDERPDSDVDLLIDRGPEPMGIYKFIGLKYDLEDALGRDVDLVSEGYINKFLELYIRPELKVIYEN